MQDMYTVLGLRNRCERQDGQWALEIEVEGDRLPRPADFNSPFYEWWRIEHDGSLRGNDNAEYVFRAPQSMEDLHKAMMVFRGFCKKYETNIDESITAGVHLHMNIQKLTPMQLMTFITCYYVMEKMLVRWCGKTRMGNHFCLRATDAEYVIHLLTRAVQERNWIVLNTEDIRYTALNLTAMFKYGSIEFRAMRSTSDLDAIEMWPKLIEQLFKGSQQFAGPQDVIQYISSPEGPEAFIRAVMGDLGPILGEPDIFEGLRVIQPLVFMTQWEDFQKRKINPFR